MKRLLVFVLSIIIYPCYAQINISVDAAVITKQLNGYENGINLNYLVDDAFIQPAPATPLATSLKNMHVKMLRYPGGEKSDNYLWSAAPWSAASPRMALKDANYFWPTNDTNFVDVNDADKKCKQKVLDFDEFMTLCNTTGAQPLIVVAYDAMYNTLPGTGIPTKAQLITNAVAWVRYANIVHRYGIKYWMIGNESWNDPTYNGQTTPAQYALDIADFAAAMKGVDPSIKIVANGKNNWWPTLLGTTAVNYIDVLAVSHYPTYNYTNGYEYYRTNNVDLIADINTAISSIYQYAPVTDTARIQVLASEYNSIDWSGNWNSDNDMGHALCNFQMLGDMMSLPKLQTACMWNTRWVDNMTNPQHVYDALDKQGNLNANGISLQIWGDNLLQNFVNATSNSNYVKVFANADALNNNINILLLNKDTAIKSINLKLDNFSTDLNGSVHIFRGISVNDKFPTYAATDTIYNIADIDTVLLARNSVTVLKLHKQDHTSVKPVADNTFTLAVVPNPVQGDVKLKINSAYNKTALFRLVNASGQNVYSKQLNIVNGINHITLLETSQLQKGIYTLSVYAGGEAISSVKLEL
jgi:alpha-N-arabinofuranosidase